MVETFINCEATNDFLAMTIIDKRILYIMTIIYDDN